MAKAPNFSSECQPLKRRGKGKRTLLAEQVKIGTQAEITNEQCLALLRQLYSANIEEITKIKNSKTAPVFLQLTARMWLGKDGKLALQRLREIERMLKLDDTPIIHDNEINITFAGINLAENPIESGDTG